MLSGSVTYLRGTRKKRVPIYSVSSLTALTTFAGQVDAYTNAAVCRVSATQVADIAGTHAALEQEFDGYYGVFRFKNTAPDEGEKPYREFHLADPIPSLFEVNTDGKRVIKKTAGEQFAAWYSTLTGKTYEFVKGWLAGG